MYSNAAVHIDTSAIQVQFSLLLAVSM